jgi:Rrf2 family nitric oxide-sensitive transcriptional repressor
VHLNRATDIALRALMLMARTGDQLTVDELAVALRVPRSHLAKVVQRLQRNGFATTVRGRTGGVQVPVELLDTTVGAVVRAFEGDVEVVNCDEPPCPLRGGCRLRTALRAAQQAFLASLDEVTLRELLAGPTGPLLLGLVSGGRS